jgi:hypothetical protein
MVLTGAMMLDWLGETESARRGAGGRRRRARGRGDRHPPDGTVAHGTRAAGQAVIDRLKR